MKKIILCISVILISMTTSAQITFQKSYGEFFIDYGQSMVQTSDGGFCIVGRTGKDLADSTDILIIRTDSLGNQIGSTRLAGTKDDFINNIALTDDGGYLLVGNTFSSPLDTGFSDIIAIKIDDGGSVFWSKTFGGTDNDEAQSVIKSGDGGYIILGSTMSYGTATKSAFAMKIDDAGNQVWTNTSSTHASNYFYAADRTLDFAYVAAGGTFNLSGGTDFDHYITKLDTLGAVLWSKSYGTTGADFLYDIKATADGGFLAAGLSAVNTAGDTDMSVIKLNAVGDIVWNFNYGTAEYDRASSVLQSVNGEILVAGYSNVGTASAVVNQMTLLRLDSTGTILWSKSYGDSSLSSEANKVLEVSDGYALCGYSIAYDPQGDVHLVKTNFAGESGCDNHQITFTRNASALSTNSGFNELTGLIDEFPTPLLAVDFIDQFSQICFSVNIGDDPGSNLFEVYPNPAKSFIRVQLNSGANHGKISICDLTGRIILSKEFSNETEILIQTEELLSGMYLLTIENDNGLATRTFIRE